MTRDQIQKHLDAYDSAIRLLLDNRRQFSREHRPLTEEVRSQLRSILDRANEQNAFGDGFEVDYIQGGVLMIGSQEMADVELVDQVAQVAEDDEEMLVLAEAERQLEAYYEPKTTER